ncbi:hypothetical protein Poli38472_006311 [Pythium oligandrum]|uniref:Heat shock protein 70 n=1 Tax=Pythium oligandrum TaxID=41045 RepID=A0A8K1CV61_PYTOL|nr:hypothetical protein Poli38472_006311 [Pythium oligandrum]|eukprot:TMW68843.1 hypothetical protein Poli38472_006311 [Pythium oligandrum]
MVVAGIDIGTTHGCVGVWQNGKVNIIANDQGFRTTPAYVCYEGDEVIVGDTAVSKLHSHAENTVFHLKRVLGKDHGEVSERGFVREWSFDVAKDKDGRVLAKTSRNGDAHEVSPVEFTSILIRNLKELAEDFTGETVDQVVMTIPAHADDAQKELIRAAAKEAGVEQLTYLSEPLAAAIAYGFDESKASHAEYVLVFDIGGATHDVTLLSVDKGLFEIVATTGNDSLGGEDFTKAVFEHCAKSFERKTKLKVQDNQKASSRLRFACEQAKRSLSTQSQVNIEVDSLLEGSDFALKLSRPRFEELINDHVKAAIKEVEKLLEEADVEKDHIDHVIVIGGSSRIPLVQNAVKKFFDGKKTHMHITPDEVVAHGATLEAAAIGEYNAASDAVNDVNVTPLTLSVGLANGSVSEVIHRDTVLPVTATESFTTSVDNQEAIFVQIYEGERVMGKDNTLLAQLRVSGITPLPKGEAEIDVTFAVNSKGALTVTATETTAGSKTLEVHNDASRLSAADVAAIIQKAEDAAEEDDALLEELEAAEEAGEEDEEASAAAPALATPSGDLD